MSKLEEAIDALNAYAQNADCIASSARITVELLQLLASAPKATKDAILPIIKDHIGNLAWDAGGNGDIGESSTDGLELVEEIVAAAVKRITRRKVEWHPHPW